MPPRFTVTVERGVRDRYGDPSASTSTHAIEGCFDWPVSSSETYGTLTEVTSDRVLFAPAGSDIRTSDTIITPDGSRWHVVGRPEHWASPYTGRRPGVEVRLREVA